MQRSTLIVFILCLSILGAFGLARHASAETVMLRLGAATIAKGYTASADDGAIRLGVLPNLVNLSATLRLEPLPNDTYPIPDGLTLVSDVWVFDVLKADATVKDPIRLSAPFTISLKHDSHTLYRKRIFFWDGNHQAWVPLPSTLDTDDPVVYSRIRLPYAAVAVFEDHNAVEGKATWLRYRYTDAAASNDFPMGSRLRVTDLDTKKSVIVVVRSKGPFGPGRVVDLASTAFKQIHPLWQGIARVRVELL